MKQPWRGGSIVKLRRAKAENERRHREWVRIMAAHEGQGHGAITRFGPMPHDPMEAGAYCPRCGWVSMATVWPRK